MLNIALIKSVIVVRFDDKKMILLSLSIAIKRKINLLTSTLLNIVAKLTFKLIVGNL